MPAIVYKKPLGLIKPKNGLFYKVVPAQFSLFAENSGRKPDYHWIHSYIAR